MYKYTRTTLAELTDRYLAAVLATDDEAIKKMTPEVNAAIRQCKMLTGMTFYAFLDARRRMNEASES